MAAPRGTSETSGSMLYVLVIFIVLFLVTTVLAIIMYVNNTDHVKRADDAEEELRRFGTAKELRAVKGLFTREDGRNVTVLGRLEADMLYLSGLIGGQDLTDFSLVGAKTLAQARVDELSWERLGDVLDNPQDANPQNGLANIVRSLQNANENLVEDNRRGEAEIERQGQLFQQELGRLNSQIAQLKEDLAQASSSAQINEEKYSRIVEEQRSQYENIVSGSEEETARMQAGKEEAQKDFVNLVKELDKHKERLRQLEKILVTVRPTPDMEMIALDPDGEVVRGGRQGEMVYINLAKTDHIYRGLTFSVYDSYQAIPKSGKGKGALEVVEIMDTFSKCRVTESDQTNPIMKGDIIANLIWDKDEEFLFCVVGDFDFDGDGKIDLDGRKRIESLINAWGGKVSEMLSVDTDFMVAGYPPIVPARPMEEFMESNTPEAIEYNSAQKRAEMYDDIRDEGAALGVPTFNISRFFRFIGYHD